MDWFSTQDQVKKKKLSLCDFQKSDISSKLSKFGIPQIPFFHSSTFPACESHRNNYRCHWITLQWFAVTKVSQKNSISPGADCSWYVTQKRSALCSRCFIVQHVLYFSQDFFPITLCFVSQCLLLISMCNQAAHPPHVNNSEFLIIPQKSSFSTQCAKLCRASKCVGVGVEGRNSQNFV